MESVLVAVTLTALVLVAAMGFVTWRVLTLERRRSDARVEELRLLAGEPGSAETVASLPGLFESAATAAPATRRVLSVAAVGAAALVLGIGAIMAFHSAPAPRSRASTGPGGGSRPLELITLGHERTSLGFTIHGLLRNPTGGEPLTDLAVVIQLFNGNGEPAGTARAPVSGAMLPPGGEARFEVPAIGAEDVAKYRVSFRAAGALVLHVDRRPRQGATTPGATGVAPAGRPVASAALRAR